MAEPFTSLLLITHFASTFFMLGVIWFVQVVHYPLFAKIRREEFHVYEQQNTFLTAWVVAPPMLWEAISAVLLFWFRPAYIPVWTLASGLALLVIIWLSTAFLQSPCHNSLSQGFDSAVHRRLVMTNWVRTAAWSLRGLLVLSIILPLLR